MGLGAPDLPSAIFRVQVNNSLGIFILNGARGKGLFHNIHSIHSYWCVSSVTLAELGALGDETENPHHETIFNKRMQELLRLLCLLS